MHGFSNRALACVIATVFALPLIPQPAKALDNVTLITDFGYNGRHAYFFVAIEKGYYKDADLE
jgi:NitT/TauT family transport system substrate-binding protein